MVFCTQRGFRDGPGGPDEDAVRVQIRARFDQHVKRSDVTVETIWARGVLSTTSGQQRFGGG